MWYSHNKWETWCDKIQKLWHILNFFIPETFSLREREEDTECNCSRELELCYRKGVDKDEMIRQLENAINTGSCPHLLCYYEATENTPEPDITSLKLTEACDATIKNQREGIFWIHLAVLTTVVTFKKHFFQWSEMSDWPITVMSRFKQSSKCSLQRIILNNVAFNNFFQ